jgi:hypothetical protein
MKRSNWLQSVASASGTGPLTADASLELAQLDELLFGAWNHGKNILLAWTHAAAELRFVAVRHYKILEPFGDNADAGDAHADRDLINTILAGPKCLDAASFDALCKDLRGAAHVIRANAADFGRLSPDLISVLLSRYGISLVRERAVILLDIVGFSQHPPLEQVAMINSLSYSANSAYLQLVPKEVRGSYPLPSFARTTTGDGFYIWNRDNTPEGNIALYQLMLLLLTDNAVAQRKAKHFPVPALRAAFHVGEHYEFFQMEAMSPTAFSYIVGQVTIDLARIIDKALPGQVLLGDFNIAMRDARSGTVVNQGTPGFITEAASTLQHLHGMSVAYTRVAEIRCYITGERAADGEFAVERYNILDKHGRNHAAYNAKINIHLQHGKPVFLGLQRRDLHHPAGGGGRWPAGD